MSLPAKTILFDLDGTLVDSAPVVGSILNGMRRSQGMPDLPLSIYRDLSSQGGAVLVGRALEIDPSSAMPWVEEFRSRYATLPTPADCLFDSVRETLETLKQAGCRLAICSNKPERLCFKVLEETGILHFFDGVVGGDTAGVAKPDRRPVDHAMALCGGAMPCYFVGDSIIDQQAARNAALPFIHFTGGYDQTIDSAYLYRSIDTIAELADLICPGKRGHAA